MNEKISHREVAVVTGATKGIGRAVAEQFASDGVTVVIGARDVNRGNAIAASLRADGRDARAVRLDVTDPATARSAAEWLAAEFGYVDVLVNNAGISGSGQVTPDQALDQLPGSVDLGTVRDVFETNVFGVITVTNAMLPLLRHSPAPRIVNVSSAAGSLAINSSPDGPMAGLPASAAYSPSKTALNALTIQYAKELRTDGILVNAADPGFVDTDINHHTGFLTPEQGAAVILRVASQCPNGPTGGFFNADHPVPW